MLLKDLFRYTIDPRNRNTLDVNVLSTQQKVLLYTIYISLYTIICLYYYLLSYLLSITFTYLCIKFWGAMDRLRGQIFSRFVTYCDKREKGSNTSTFT